jgi:hypothetical protein
MTGMGLSSANGTAEPPALQHAPSFATRCTHPGRVNDSYWQTAAGRPSNFGDQFNDQIGGSADRAITLPNPTYCLP